MLPKRQVYVSAGALATCSDMWLLLTCHLMETLCGWASSAFILLANLHLLGEQLIPIWKTVITYCQLRVFPPLQISAARSSRKAPAVWA